uniref:JAB domain-containing protein n=1 Tax=Pedobacter schmidteae TaxID=2201271 RepID=UPI000EAD6D27|nr:JAB domain-containing protein [Pedobacter schmidteae]
MAHQSLLNVSEIEVNYRTHYSINERPVIVSSKLAYEIFMEHWPTGKIQMVEETYMLLLNKANRVLGIVHISTGTLSACLVDFKVVFSIALKALASKILIAHNHPSGDLRPSVEDMKLTKRLGDAAKLLNIEFCDHLIITTDGYTSFMDEGLV